MKAYGLHSKFYVKKIKKNETKYITLTPNYIFQVLCYKRNDEI